MKKKTGKILNILFLHWSLEPEVAEEFKGKGIKYKFNAFKKRYPLLLKIYTD